jgi:hypothetical protein
MQDRISRVEETSCTARPDHTSGSNHDLTFLALMSAFTSYGHTPAFGVCYNWSSTSRLLDDLVGDSKQIGRYLHAERPSGLEIDYQFEFGCLQNR